MESWKCARSGQCDGNGAECPFCRPGASPTREWFIHGRDWLIKILLMTLTLWFINRNAELRVNQTPVLAAQGN